jgi:hypothetical protein
VVIPEFVLYVYIPIESWAIGGLWVKCDFKSSIFEKVMIRGGINKDDEMMNIIMRKTATDLRNNLDLISERCSIQFLVVGLALRS